MPKRQPQSQTAAHSTTRPRKAARTTEPVEPTTMAVDFEDETPPTELPTEFAFGTDGCLYINAESLKPGEEKDRPKFVGYQLTDEEKEQVMDALHRTAWNATPDILNRKKRR